MKWKILTNFDKNLTILVSYRVVYFQESAMTFYNKPDDGLVRPKHVVLWDNTCNIWREKVTSENTKVLKHYDVL
jgi:hypothetical protein